MKKQRLIAPALCLALCLSLCQGLLTGCGRRDDPETPSEATVQTAEVPAEEANSYAATFRELPETFSTSAECITLVDQTLYAAYYGLVGEREPTEKELQDYPNESWIHEQYGITLYALPPEGEAEETRLENYAPLSIPEGKQGTSYCSTLLPGPEQTLWSVESLYAYTDTDSSESYFLRQLDLTGRELQAIPLDFIGSGRTIEYLNGAAVDGAGNLYFSGESVMVMTDGAGQVLAALQTEDWIDRLVQLGDGRVGAAMYHFGGDSSGYVVRTADAAAQAWSREPLPLPDGCSAVFDGTGDYLLLASDGLELYGLNGRTMEYEALLNWVDSDISSGDVQGFLDLGEGALGFLLMDWVSSRDRMELARLVPGQMPQKTTLTLATAHTDSVLQSAVVRFNRQSSEYRITILDYSTLAEGSSADPEDLLKNDLLTGNAPDLVNLIGIGDDKNLYLKKSILEDLMPYLEADPELSAQDLMPCYLSAAGRDGKLYEAYSRFCLSALLGRADTLGSKDGWTWEELEALAEAHPEMTLFGSSTTQTAFLQTAAAYTLDSFVNWDAGTCSFEDPAFVRLLELASTLPAKADRNADQWTDILNKTQLLYTGKLYCFDEVSQYASLFGGEITYVGFPGGAGNGSGVSAFDFSIALCSASSEKAGAWEFIRMLLSEDYQTNNTPPWSDFYTNRQAMEKHIQHYLDTYVQYDANGNLISNGGMGWGEDGLTLDTYPATREQIDAFLEAANGAAAEAACDPELMNIITEEAGACFAGQHTAADCAAIIQSRAAIYLSEQS